MRFESVMRLREKLDELGKMKGIAQDEKGIKKLMPLLYLSWIYTSMQTPTKLYVLMSFRSRGILEYAVQSHA